MIVLSVYWVCKVQAAFQRRKKCANRNPRTFKLPKSSLHFNFIGRISLLVCKIE